MKHKAILIFILLLIHQPLFAAGPAAPVFQGLNLKGDAFNSRQLTGQPIVLSFFASTCAPCRKEMPVLYKLMKDKGKEKNLLFIDPLTEALKFADPDDARKVKTFVRKLSIPEEMVYFDDLGSLTSAFMKMQIFKKANKLAVPIYFPTIVVLDKNHNVVSVLEGEGETFIKEIPKWL